MRYIFFDFSRQRIYKMDISEEFEKFCRRMLISDSNLFYSSTSGNRMWRKYFTQVRVDEECRVYDFLKFSITLPCPCHFHFQKFEYIVGERKFLFRVIQRNQAYAFNPKTPCLFKVLYFFDDRIDSSEDDTFAAALVVWRDKPFIQ